MPVMPKVIKNPYVKNTFKHYFIEEFNKLAIKKRDQEVQLPVVLAESFAIFLELVNEDIKEDDKAHTIILEGDTNAKSK